MLLLFQFQINRLLQQALCQVFLCLLTKTKVTGCEQMWQTCCPLHGKAFLNLTLLVLNQQRHWCSLDGYWCESNVWNSDLLIFRFSRIVHATVSILDCKKQLQKICWTFHSSVLVHQNPESEIMLWCSRSYCSFHILIHDLIIMSSFDHHSWLTATFNFYSFLNTYCIGHLKLILKNLFSRSLIGSQSGDEARLNLAHYKNI